MAITLFFFAERKGRLSILTHEVEQRLKDGDSHIKWAAIFTSSTSERHGPDVPKWGGADGADFRDSSPRGVRLPLGGLWNTETI